MIFLGTLVLGDETRALRYGRDRERDLIGVFERSASGAGGSPFPIPITNPCSTRSSWSQAIEVRMRSRFLAAMLMASAMLSPLEAQELNQAIGGTCLA